jgi:hypothetical protein
MISETERFNQVLAEKVLARTRSLNCKRAFPFPLAVIRQKPPTMTFSSLHC